MNPRDAMLIAVAVYVAIDCVSNLRHDAKIAALESDSLTCYRALDRLHALGVKAAQHDAQGRLQAEVDQAWEHNKLTLLDGGDLPFELQGR